MKLASDIAKKSLNKSNEARIVHKIAVLGGWKNLETPKLSTELSCTICQKSDHYAPIMFPPSPERVWVCADGFCASNMSVYTQSKGITPTPPSRAILWPKFCELNGIGDVHEDVRFENIHQSAGKIEFMKNFLIKPSGIIHMQGEPGTGKTYCAMGMCEYYTRKNISCIFSTQKQMFNLWMETFKSEGVSNYIQKVTTVNFLVIDDFGTGEVSAGFMSFFLDLINTRMQYKSRGTVITTNLSDEKFGVFCGDALADRIQTGQVFLFEGTSKRINNPL
jgi:hypothetical protein